MGAKKQQIFSDLLLVCRCDGRCVIQLLAVKVKLEQAFYQLLNDMILHFHIDMTVYFGIGADISGVMGKDSSKPYKPKTDSPLSGLSVYIYSTSIPQAPSARVKDFGFLYKMPVIPRLYAAWALALLSSTKIDSS